jgi:superfamily II DNA/RNA helicase
MTHKNKLLEHLLIAPDMNQAIIFTSTKRHADVLAEDLYAAGHKTAALHGDMTQGARNRTLTKLRHGDVKVLVATDVAARGIDVQGISHVINYDLPKFAEDYVHRIGRTGRANNTGIAISFASNMDRHILRKIEQFTGHRMEPAIVEGFEPKRSFNANSGKNDGSAGKRGGRNDRAHKPGDRGGYQPRSNEKGRSFGDRISSNRAPSERTFGEKSSGKPDFKSNNRPQVRTFSDRPVRNVERFANSNNESTGNRQPREGSGEVNGNSRSYTKDTDMQFARQLSQEFVGRKSNGTHDEPRVNNSKTNHSKINTEKFGNPNPRSPRTNKNAPSGARFHQGENSPKRPRSFA